MKGKFINELEPGQKFGESVFVIRDVVLKTAQNGSEYLTCTLADRSGSARQRCGVLPRNSTGRRVQPASLALVARCRMANIRAA